MALDEQNGGGFGGSGECWRCEGWGLATQRISGAEARRMTGSLPHLPEGAVITYAHVTMICDCAAGDRIRESMAQRCVFQHGGDDCNWMTPAPSDGVEKEE